MSDNKNARDGRDGSRVDVNDPSEVEYLHRQYPEFTHEQIVAAIKEAGPIRADIEKLLERKRAK